MISLYGGFNGTETQIDARDWLNNTTTLHGSIWVANSGIIDGFLIEYGAGFDAVSPGAMWIDGHYMPWDPLLLTISNCRFMNNTGGYGGAIYIQNSQVTITNCTFKENTSTAGYGGALEIDSSTVDIINSTFLDNTGGYGGAIRNLYSTVNITNSTFSGNSGGSGGAIANDISSTMFVTNCLFTDNSGGSAIQNSGTGPTIATINNSTFINNNGGAIFNYRPEAVIIITNSILWGNGSPDFLEINNYEGTFTVSYSNIDQDGYGLDPSGDPDANGNIRKDPLVVNATDIDPANWDLHLTEESPCIDMGDSSAAGLPSDDMDGNPRIVGSAIDMGAYEYQGVDNDIDDDGFDPPLDCDDNDPEVNPDMTEIPYNSKDDDCNESTPDDDLDGDGLLKQLTAMTWI